MAKLTEDIGARMLHCGLCRMEWLFKRIGCPFCGNEAQDKLRFFSDEKVPAYRVDVCDECKGYLKAVDARVKKEPLCMFVENLATLHLDIVAEREGDGKRTGRRTDS